MKRYARIVDGAVVETIDLPDHAEPADRFHPDIAGQFVPCGNEVLQRMRFDGKAFSPAPEPEPPPAEDLLAASDARAARKIDDLVDALIAKGVLAKRDLPEDAAAWLDERKALRGEISRKGD